MDDALLKQLVNGEAVDDIWNHLSTKAVTIVFKQGGIRRRLLISVDCNEKKALYHATTPVYIVGGKTTWWDAESQFPEEAVSRVWKLASAIILPAIQQGIVLNPEFTVNPEYPNGPHNLVWPQDLSK